MPSERAVANSIIFYPLIGFIIGVLLLIVAWLFGSIQAMLLTAIVLTTWVLLTGGLHLDGLADSADAWAGGFGDSDKTLQIMKDPYCGPAAVVTLLLVLLIKFSAIFVILQSGNIFYLIVPPLLARTSVPVLYQTTSYVRQAGLGSNLSARMPVGAVAVAIFFSMLMTVLLLGQAVWIILAVFIVSFVAIRWLMIKRIGGTTGDTTGALIELTETTALIAIASL